MFEEKAIFTMKLRSCGNPDFGQYAPVSNPETVEAATLQELVVACEKYIDFWNLGGGNWVTPVVKKGTKSVAWISYNGRIWDHNPNKVTK